MEAAPLDPVDHPSATTIPVAEEAVTARATTENFPVALRVLTRDQRRHLMAIYGFARLTDQTGDDAKGDRLALLDELERQLDRALEGDAAHEVLQNLAPTYHELSLPREPFLRLIQANRQDQILKRYATFEDLLGYCELSANPVGELVLHVFGVATPERIRHSDAVCTGLQLVEHWQDVAEDFANGRIYLPTEDMTRFGCRDADLAAETANDALKNLLRFEADRAQAYIDEGIPLVHSLAGRARWAICGFVAGGSAAIDSIVRRSYDVLPGAPEPGKRDFVRHFCRILFAARSGKKPVAASTAGLKP